MFNTKMFRLNGLRKRILSAVSALFFAGFAVSPFSAVAAGKTDDAKREYTLTKPLKLTKEELADNPDIRRYTGLGEELFDSDKANLELSSSGIEVMIRDNKPVMALEIADKEGDYKRYEAPISNKRFNKLVSAVTLDDYFNGKKADSIKSRWSNEGQLGYAFGLGPIANVYHSQKIDDNKGAGLSLALSRERQSVELDLRKHAPHDGSRLVSLRGVSGNDIEDNRYKQLRLISQSDAGGFTGIYQLGLRDDSDNEETSPDLKYGFASGNLAGSIYYDRGFGISSYMIIPSVRGDDSVESLLAEQVREYDRYSISGNHPLFSPRAKYQLSLGLEESHINLEAARNFSNFGFFMGYGRIWHGYNNPYAGLSVKLSENIPVISFSISKDKSFFDIRTPRMRIDRKPSIFY